MTTLTLPNEIINKILSYIEGKHNQIIKKEFIRLNSFGNDLRTPRNIKFTFDLIKSNLIKDKYLYNKAIRYGKYFKYSILHLKRKNLFNYIKSLIINDYNYTKILTQVRNNYIYDYYYTYDLTRSKFRKYYNTRFKYIILHENHKKVCNDIKRYKFKKHIIKTRHCN
jgi:hypothetical protein